MVDCIILMFQLLFLLEEIDLLGNLAYGHHLFQTIQNIFDSPPRFQSHSQIVRF